jgi:hypothetical protein
MPAGESAEITTATITRERGVSYEQSLRNRMNATLRQESNVMYTERFRYPASYLNSVPSKSCTLAMGGKQTGRVATEGASRTADVT